MRGLSKKRLLRKAVEPLLPAEVVNGRKRGFSIPAAAWLRGELEPFARETLSAETLRRQGYLQPEAVARVLDDHVAGREDLSRQLWGLLAFTLWHERHVEGVRRDTSLANARRGGALMRIWIDMTASAHPLVFRPLVELLRARGDEVEITARQYAQTLQLIESHGMTATPIGHHGGRSRLGKARQMTLAAARAAALGARARLRPRARARLARADDDRAPARDPERDDVRLRVGVARSTSSAAAPRRSVVVPDVDPGRAPRAATARCRRSSSSTRA